MHRTYGTYPLPAGAGRGGAKTQLSSIVGFVLQIKNYTKQLVYAV